MYSSTSSDSDTAAARIGRRLATDSRSEAIAAKLDINQTDYVETLDLQTYDAQLAVKEGRDYCTSGALVVRGMQVQAIIFQTVMVMKGLSPDTDFSSKAGEIFPVIAQAILGSGFAKFKTQAGYDDLATLWAATNDEKDVITDAMKNSYLMMDEKMPKCPALSSWQRELLNLHNTKRTLHGSQPMNWDHSLASLSANFAATCPQSPDTHSAGSINENVVYAAVSSSTQVGAMQELFAHWYNNQIEAYMAYDGYYTAQGPCNGRTGVNFTVPVSINAPEGWLCLDGSQTNTRVTEFAQLLWADHTTFGCGSAVCPFGQALVCQYTKKDCEGDDCYGNTLGEFQTNVMSNSSTAGPRGARAWPMVNAATQGAYVAQGDLPAQMGAVMEDRSPAAIAAFMANTSLAALLNASFAANIPLLYPFPPSPPTPPPAPVASPLPPAGVIPGTFAQTADAEVAALGWVWIVVLILMLVFLLGCCMPLVLYRVSGGEPMLWLGLQLSHSSPNIAMGFKPEEDREQIAADVGIYQQAMFDAIKSYKYSATGWFHMRRDHINFIKAGGVMSKRTEYGLPYPEKPDSELETDSAIDIDGFDGSGLPENPGIDPDLNAEFTETPDDRNRRLEWIRYYVREKDLPRAYDLGWDGKPFRQAAFLPAERALSVSSGASAAGSAASGGEIVPAGRSQAGPSSPAGNPPASALHRI